MGVTNDEIMEAIKENCTQTKEIKAAIETIALTLKTAVEEVAVLKAKCEDLENRNVILENEMKFLKRQLRLNNFIIHKIPEPEIRSNENILKTVQKVCEAADIILPDSAVNNCFRLGSGSNDRPILVSLNSNILKSEIMKRKEVFINNKTPISHDRSPEDRQLGRRIFNCISYLRKIDKNASYFKSKFKCRSVVYSIEEVEEMISSSSHTPNKEEISNSKKLKSRTAEKLLDFRFRE